MLCREKLKWPFRLLKCLQIDNYNREVNVRYLKKWNIMNQMGKNVSEGRKNYFSFSRNVFRLICKISAAFVLLLSTLDNTFNI